MSGDNIPSAEGNDGGWDAPIVEDVDQVGFEPVDPAGEHDEAEAVPTGGDRDDMTEFAPGPGERAGGGYEPRAAEELSPAGHEPTVEEDADSIFDEAEAAVAQAARAEIERQAQPAAQIREQFEADPDAADDIEDDQSASTHRPGSDVDDVDQAIAEHDEAQAASPAGAPEPDPEELEGLFEAIGEAGGSAPDADEAGQDDIETETGDQGPASGPSETTDVEEAETDASNADNGDGAEIYDIPTNRANSPPPGWDEPLIQAAKDMGFVEEVAEYLANIPPERVEPEGDQLAEVIPLGSRGAGQQDTTESDDRPGVERREVDEKFLGTPQGSNVEFPRDLTAAMDFLMEHVGGDIGEMAAIVLADEFEETGEVPLGLPPEVRQEIEEELRRQVAGE